MSQQGSLEPDEARVESLLNAFRDAWHSGTGPDPEDFLREHADCGDELRQRIESFLFVVGGLREIAEGPAKTPRPPGNGGDPCNAETELGPAGEQLGEYRIIREIGRGGMGVVYEAEQTSLRRRVALKVLPGHLRFSTEAVQKFRREAEAGGRQHHPGIVSIHAVGEHEGVHFIAQELVDGATNIEDRLEAWRQEGELPRGYFREVARIVAEVAEALQHAHDSGVIHRDVKPSNILITPDGAAKVSDFGLAKVTDALALSRTGDLAGTPFYMSPEQASSDGREIDHRTDVYSLGVTLYEMLALRRPFDGVTSLDVLKKVVSGIPPDPRRVNPRVPQDLAVICLKAMEKQCDDRYRRMADFAEDLHRYLSGDVILAQPSGPITRVWKRMRNHPRVSTTVAASVLVVLILAVTIPWLLAIKDRQTRDANNRYEEIISLSDTELLAALEAEANDLWPARPEHIPRYEAWIESAVPLIERLDAHRRTLEDTARTLPDAGRESPAPGSLPADMRRQWQRRALETLVTGIESLRDEENGTVASIRKRLAFAREIRRRSIGDHEAAWKLAIRTIADARLCPSYGGLAIEPMLGYVPLGLDPASGLYEFALLRTGSAPERDPSGKLLFDEHSGLVMVLVPGGSFRMGAMLPDDEHPEGSPNVDPDSTNFEGPPHRVTCPPFLISKYEMTYGQWYRATGKDNAVAYAMHYMAHYKETIPLHVFPVTDVSWDDCREALPRIGLRMPSEAEWEYAARAGTTSVWWTGNDEESVYGVANILGTGQRGRPNAALVEQWGEDIYSFHAPVHTLAPNPFGLHHVCGNVWEWCADSWSQGYARTPTDGSAWDGGPDAIWRMKRGGCWDGKAVHCRSAYRHYIHTRFKNWHHGIRPVASLPQ